MKLRSCLKLRRILEYSSSPTLSQKKVDNNVLVLFIPAIFDYVETHDLFLSNISLEY